MRSVIVIMLLLLSKLGASAQTPAGIAYYDVDRLYDTIPSLFYDDRAYTPEGTYGWDTERYRRKIRQVAETVDSMALPVVALYGVETEQVARDIAARCVEDYACLHRTLSSRNGLDFALLYWGDRLFIRSVESGFDYLSVDGTLDGRPLLLVLSRYSSTAEHIAAKRAKADEQCRIVIMGRTDNFATKDNTFRDATAKAEAAGRGNALFRSGWTMADRILVTHNVTADAEVYARRRLLDSEGRPAATFSRRRYTAGCSNRLPIYIYLH
ncbi:hypothetical protein IMSAGC022_01317 [Alistipes sp.]|jgi:hypothetical protein|nr:hypothetical protein IMSAGC022_01317 [Alistipes sp.]